MSTKSGTSLINRAIPSLFNGVSQQPAALRLPSQCQEQTNGYAALVDGLIKRPPSIFQAKLNTDTDEDSFVHYINRDSTERYTLIIKDGEYQIYNLSGTAMTLVWSDQTFLCQDDAVAVGNGQSEQFFIPSSESTITLTSTGITTATIVWEKSSTGAFGGEEVTVRTDTVDTSGTIAWTSGDYLRARISAWTAGTIDAQVTWKDSSYFQVAGAPRDSFEVVTVADFTFIVNKEKIALMDSDVTGNTDAGTVQDFASLPGAPTNNDVYYIQGDPNNAFDGYYVRWDNTAGVWIEDAKVGIEYKFAARTMPHSIARTATNTFTFNTVTWGNREVGDLVSSPTPSFIGRTINDIFFHRNRLGLLAGDSVILSASPASDYNFFRNSATVLVDSDPIDTAASHTKVSTLYHAIPFDKSLLLISEQTQFILSGGNVLTPSSATIDVTTEFEASIKAKPVGAGANLYFPVPKGNFSGIREYFVEDEVTTNDAADITAHIPTYLDKDIFQLVASSNEDVLLAISSNTRNKIWNYKYFWQGDEKVQSSWSTWEFASGDVILGVGMIETDIYLTIKRSDGTYLEKIPLESDLVDTGMGIQVLLDQREELLGVYDAGNDWTTWTTSNLHGDAFEVILGADFTNQIGQKLDSITYPTTTTIRKTGDFSTGNCFVGKPYTFTYKFSEQFLRDANRNAIREGRLMLRNMAINYTDSGYFKVTVEPEHRNINEYEFTGKILGGGFLLGQLQIKTGSLLFPIMADSRGVVITIMNDSHLPSNFQSAEWNALYHGKAIR